MTKYVCVDVDIMITYLFGSILNDGSEWSMVGHFKPVYVCVGVCEWVGKKERKKR